MIKPLMMLLALALPACNRDEPGNAAGQTNSVLGAQPAARDRVSRPPEIVEKPKDQAHLDRMILAGFTPHADHLHPPGVNKCPLSKGTEAVM